MKIGFEINYAIKQLARNKGRTGLTLLGIVIGIASIIIVFSAGEGMKGLILGQVEAFGTDFIQVEIKVPSSKKGMEAEQQNAAAIMQGVQITTLTLDDVAEINKHPNVKMSYAGIMAQEKAGYQNQLHKAIIFGTNASYVDIDKSEVGYGNFFSEADNRSLSQVAVLGSKIKEKLFGESDPIGRSITLHKTKFRVIGVMKERGAVMTMDFDDYIFVPIRTLQKKVLGINHVLYTVHQLNDAKKAEQTAEDIRYILRDNHNIISDINPDGTINIGRDDFRVTTMDEMMDMLDIITNTLTLLLIAITMVSLVVGGVGVMNIMYVIVNERISEIGLRKAVGATNSDILKNFLLESVLVTLLGALIGIALGILASFMIYVVASQYFSDWSFSIPARAFVVTLAFSTIFGVLFGLYPARKAARLDPIEALRTE